MGRAIPDFSRLKREDYTPVSEITARKKKRGRRRRSDTDGCEGNIPPKPRPWSRAYWAQREDFLASALTTLPPDEEPRIHILFLDDMVERHDHAHEWLKGVLNTSGLLIQVHHVYSVGAAFRALEDMDFDVVCLDHDLEEAHYTTDGKHENTGMDVAEKLAKEKYKGLAIVHSWNPDAAKRMVQVLSQAGVNVERREFGFK